MSLTYICAVCGEPGHVYPIGDILMVSPCDHGCSPKVAHLAAVRFQAEVDTKEEWPSPRVKALLNKRLRQRGEPERYHEESKEDKGAGSSGC